MKLFAAVFSLASLGFATPAHAVCFQASIPFPCTENDHTVQIVPRSDDVSTMFGKDPYTGHTFRMVTRQVGTTTVYNGEANGKTWRVVKRPNGYITNYSGTDSNGKSFSYNCTERSCEAHANPTSIVEDAPNRFPSPTGTPPRSVVAPKNADPLKAFGINTGR